MNIILPIILLVHGFAHLVGFMVSWKIGNLKDPPYRTTLFNGKINIGDRGIRIFGVVWLVVGVLFFIDATMVVFQLNGWKLFLIVISILSLLICVLGLPDSKIGIIVNICILALMAIVEIISI